MSDHSHQLQKVFAGENPALRMRKAERILALLGGRGLRPAETSCLEIGTGSGVMGDIFQNAFRVFISVDVEDIRLPQASVDNFCRAAAAALPFPDQQFDIVIFTHVYQYLPDKDPALGEIARVLKPGGVCYFATSNRYALVEPHYHLPLLGYLPRRLADLYLRTFRAGSTVYDISSEDYRSLMAGVSRHFSVEDLTVYFIKNHRNYAFDDVPAIKLLAWLPLPILALLERTIMTNWIMLLHKK